MGFDAAGTSNFAFSDEIDFGKDFGIVPTAGAIADPRMREILGS